MTLAHHPQNVNALTQQDLANLRGTLLRQRSFRRDQLDGLGRNVMRTRPSTEADREVERSLRAGARTTLHEIDLALGRMRTGAYGRCLGCGSELARERLELVPHAALCEHCQQAREHSA